MCRKIFLPRRKRGALRKEEAVVCDSWPRHFDVAIMKNIRTHILAAAVGIVSLMGTTHEAYAQKRFVEQAPEQQTASVIDPELKRVMPLAFTTIKTDTGTPDQDDATLFAPLYVDNTKGKVRSSISTQKIMPIGPDGIIGISTYFSRFHPGVDYRAKVGTAIHAMLPGTVNEIGFERGGYGRYIVLVHHVDGKTIFSLYAHMRMSAVTLGDIVDAGQKIGEVGLTGHTTGPHLHFEIHDDFRAMDPMKFFASNVLAMVVKI